MQSYEIMTQKAPSNWHQMLVLLQCSKERLLVRLLCIFSISMYIYDSLFAGATKVDEFADESDDSA